MRDRRAATAVLAVLVAVAGVAVAAGIEEDAPTTLRTAPATHGTGSASGTATELADDRPVTADASAADGSASLEGSTSTADGSDGVPDTIASAHRSASTGAAPTTAPAPAPVGRAAAQKASPAPTVPTSHADRAEHAVPMTQDRIAPPAPTSTPTTTRPPTTTSTAPQGVWRPMRTAPDGSVGRYDPCTPIRYVTRLAGGPAFARSELDWAVAQLEAASGLDLVWAGDVATPFSDAWAAANDTAHVGFATAAEFWLPAGVSGYGDSTPATIGGRLRLTDGRVVLRPDHGWTQGTSSANPLGLMFLHELGHLVGLAHVDVATEVMTDRGNGTMRSLGPGDRRGLAAVGRPAGCL